MSRSLACLSDVGHRIVEDTLQVRPIWVNSDGWTTSDSRSYWDGWTWTYIRRTISFDETLIHKNKYEIIKANGIDILISRIVTFNTSKATWASAWRGNATPQGPCLVYNQIYLEEELLVNNHWPVDLTTPIVFKYQIPVLKFKKIKNKRTNSVATFLNNSWTC